MRLFAIFVALLFLPLATAISDLSVYAEGHYESQADAPILVEWFHGEGDEEALERFVEMDRDGEITLLHWRTGAEEEDGGLPEDDANARMMFHNFSQTPSVAIDGYPENGDSVGAEVRTNEVEIEWNIQLIGSTEVELLNITATWTNPKALNGATQMHVFIIESEAVDSKGRIVHNLVRDWAPSSTFFFTNNTTNQWNETITRDHLDGAGIDLGDASHADDYEMLLVMIGGFENESGNRVLSIQRGKMPTYWQSVDRGASMTPLLLLIGLIFCIGFVVVAERKREIGLPRLEGSWTSENGVLEYRIVTGYSIEIGELIMGKGWRANGRIKKESVPPNQTHVGTLRVSGEGSFSMQLCVKVDELGDWILDLNLPEPRTND